MSDYQTMRYFTVEFSHAPKAWTCTLGWESEEDGNVAYCADAETPVDALVTVLEQAREYGELVPERTQRDGSEQA